MSSPDKPYRRFRAHGRGDLTAQEALDAVRALRERAAAKDADVVAPTPPVRPARPAPKVRPSWWSLRHRSRASIIRRIALVLLVGVVVWAVAGFLALRGAASEANSRISQTARRALADPHGGLLGTAENTLIIGSDADRGRTGSRADTIMIMRTDPSAGRINYLSIPRDLRIPFDGGSHIKIAESYSHRGIRGVIGAIRQEVGIPIHHVIVVDFTAVAKMVDAVGGIEVNNPFELVNCAYPGGITVTFGRGRLRLDGKRALQYSRVRKCDGDIQRAQRQQLVVGALRAKTLSLTSLPVAPFRGASIIRTLSTDLSTTDLAKFGWLQARLQTGSREVLATRGETISGISYQALDPNRAGPQLRQFTR